MAAGRGILVAPGTAASMAFFMTLGKASRAISPRRRPPMALGLWRRVDVGPVDDQLQCEMGEDVADFAGPLPLRRERGGRQVRYRRRAAPSSRWSAPRSCRPGGRPDGRRRKRMAPSGRTATKAAPVRSRPFGPRRLDRETLRIALRQRRAVLARAGTRLQAGRRGVQTVAPRSIIAWAKSPGRSCGQDALHEARGFRAFALGSGVSIARQARDDALDIAVDDGRRAVEGDRGDRRRRVGADARQRAQARFRRRGTRRHARAPPHRRTASGCAPANSSRGRPRPSSPARPRPRPARRRPATAPGSARNTASPPLPWSAAALPRRAIRGRDRARTPRAAAAGVMRHGRSRWCRSYQASSLSAAAEG